MFRQIAVLFLLISLAWAQATKPIETRAFQTVAPANWEERLTESTLYLLYPGRDASDPQHAHVSITPSSVSSGMSLDAFTFMAKHGVESSYPELKLGYSKPAMLGKLEGHRFEYRGNRGGKKFLLIQVMAIAGKDGYTVEFRGSESDYASVRSGFEQMLKVFKGQ